MAALETPGCWQASTSCALNSALCYAIGGTRSRILDVLFVLALLSGAGFPIGHLTVRWLFRKMRERRGDA